MTGEWDQPGLPSHDFTNITHLSVRPSEQGLVLILISLVAGSQPAGRSKDGMCSFGHFLKNQGTRVPFLKTGRRGLDYPWSWTGLACVLF